jgi:hypothetical protein
MNLRSDGQQNVRSQPNLRSQKSGEARQAGGEALVSLRAGSDPESQPISRTAVVRTRMPGGVGGAESRGSPLSRSHPKQREDGVADYVRNSAAFALDDFPQLNKAVVERSFKPLGAQLYCECGGAHDVDEDRGNDSTFPRLVLVDARIAHPSL